MKPTVEIKELQLLPCAIRGMCPECATRHEPWEPHYLCLHYQFHFRKQHGRFPTWADAMAHCTEEVKKTTIEVLEKYGVQV